MTDFIIIGGGVGGTSSGAALSKLGTVTLLEAETQLAYHASGRSAALFEETYGQPSTIALNAASHAHHVAHDLLSPRGIMCVGKADNVDQFRADQIHLELTELSPQEAQAIVPTLNLDVVTHAGLNMNASDLDTDRMIQGYVKTIRDNGGALHTDAAVTGIARTASGWTVTTKQGDFHGSVLVNAAGPWADQVAALADIAPIGLTPYRRSMGRIPAPAGLDLSNWPMIFGAGETWYCKPDAGALIVSPAEEHVMPPCDAYVDDMVLAEGFARYEAHMTEPVTRLLSSWAGLRTFSPDRTLVLGPDPADPAFVWCAGQGGYGMQSSPAAGALLADLINNKTPAIDAGAVAELRPDRFR